MLNLILKLLFATQFIAHYGSISTRFYILLEISLIVSQKIIIINSNSSKNNKKIKEM